jgi:hypothetical protein
MQFHQDRYTEQPAKHLEIRGPISILSGWINRQVEDGWINRQLEAGRRANNISVGSKARNSGTAASGTTLKKK